MIVIHKFILSASNEWFMLHKVIYNKTPANKFIWQKYLSKEEGKDQESIQSSTTPDQGHRITFCIRETLKEYFYKQRRPR